ncbi:hypothetical protein [Streptomyces griseocarneus]|uniref:hypothetical protein n=1 Tax=Streptomyces griseocarneus TaxID=51201 RepID=UPI00167E8753|nr:hypothetical protein [Streptomyces griseocarneus]MBZ6475029.1 hypothetical protein [Streptomyces griseocarneus]GHG62681.1 hypothetical protein GCM10018779_31580 [Streptomyces griseocarneus]
MFEFLPEVGIRLPGRAGTLRLGMDERAAQWAVATVADVHERWVCGAGWAFTAQYDGLTLHAHGDTRNRDGAHEDVSGLAEITLTRAPDTLAAGSGCPVVLHGIDLFGYPAAEVLDALGGAPPATFRLAGDGDGRYLITASLRAEAVRGAAQWIRPCPSAVDVDG